MDPNATLAEIRRILDRWRNDASWAHDMERLALLTEALDEWISKGGFLPNDWRK